MKIIVILDLLIHEWVQTVAELEIYVRGGKIKKQDWKTKINLKKLININNKISKQLYDNVIVIQNLT